MQLKQSLHRSICAFVTALVVGHMPVHAEECKKPKVFFVNGVQNYQWEAQNASRQLETAISANGGPANLHITTLYNPTDPDLGDAIEVAQDYLLARNHLIFSWSMAFLADVELAVLGLTTASPELFFDSILGKKISLQWLENKIDGTTASIRNEEVIAKIQRTLLQEVKVNKTPVMVIAHSEGNFYLNEAVRRLKTSDITKDIPGVQAIGVLGIGVASRLNPATLPSGPLLYSYITKSDDLVIVLLQDELPANFTNVVYDPDTVVTLTNHELVDDYLNPFVTGSYNGVPDQSIRKVVADEFNKVYDTVLEAFPCVDNGAAEPEAIVAEQPVTLSARMVSRDGVLALAFTGSVTFTDGNGVEFCTSAVGFQGTASCTHTFQKGSIPEKIYAQWKSGVFQSLPHVFDAKPGGSYWEGGLVVTSCTIVPEWEAVNGNFDWGNATFAWESACYTGLGYGVSSYNPHALQFRFEDDGETVVLDGFAEGLHIRKHFNVRWRSADSLGLNIRPCLSLFHPITNSLA